MSWVFSPQASLAICKVDAPTQTIRDVFVCRTVTDIEATLSTGATVGEASFQLANYDGLITKHDADKPHAMDIVCLALCNRYNQWGIDWTGIVDEVHSDLDPTQGDLVTLACTSPQKYFEIRRQTQTDVITLDVAALTGIKGSDLVRYACQTARVNYPGPLAHLPQALAAPGPWRKLTWLAIDPHAEDGIKSWTGGVPSGDFTQPPYQTWNAVLSPVAAQSGLEWFFDECGRLIWRRPGFLAAVSTAQPIPVDEIYSLDLFESDATVVTRVEVRWGSQQTVQTASWWQAPPSMVRHLTPRTVTVQAEWIVGAGARQAAQNLATLLGQFYAANVLQGTVIVPLNPAYRIGSLVQIPGVRGRAGGIYYVSAKMDKLTWGQTAVCVLGLAYGRNAAAQFPYGVRNTYPSLYVTPQEGLQGSHVSILSNGLNLGAVQTAPGMSQVVFTLVAKAGVAPDQVLADPSLVPVGATIRLYNAAQSTGSNGKSDATAVAGPSPTGQYSVLAGNIGQGPILYVSAVGRYPQVYVALQDPGTGVDPSLTGVITGGSPTTGGSGTTPVGTGFPSTPQAVADTQKFLNHSPQNLAQEAFSVALAQQGNPYVTGGAAPGGFDCSGLVYYAYLTAGYQWTRLVAGRQYSYFLAHGASERTLTDTPVLGDLLFYGDMNNSQAQHVGFYDGQGGVYSAQYAGANPDLGTVNPYTALLADFKYPLSHVLNMQSFGSRTVMTPTTGGVSAFTDAQIAAATGAPLANIQASWPIILGALHEQGIDDTPVQIAAIATVAVETAVTMNGQNMTFLSVPADPSSRTSAEGQWYGRSFVQLTWDYNYKQYGTAVGIDLWGNPDLALQPDVGARVLALYFINHNVPADARAGRWPQVREDVNGGLNGYDVFWPIVQYLEAL